MNTGQMLITIAALTLVVITTLNHNRASLTTQDNMIYNKEFILATSVGQSILDEISGKAYDEEIIKGTKILSANNFSSTLGKETGENYPNFDDVDDYNNLVKIDTIPNMGEFTSYVYVDYMNDDLQVTTSKSFNKSVTVRITSPTLLNYFTDKPDTMTITSLFSQWVML
ncbi:MAG: hypothetical protein IPH62_04875 [Ignavibacteriae bacterium]|nr:hypothetical protein [Ignavibacteriota bacterium]